MLRGVGLSGRLFFWAMLAVFGLLVVLALAAGWWLPALFAAGLAVMFTMTAPFVLGRRWRPRDPALGRRPVVRRRR